MNWNGYDTKYIIKRLIIGFGMLILFSILTTHKAKAETIVANGYLSSTSDILNINALVSREKTYNIGQFAGKKNGEVYFAMSISRSMEVQNIYVIESNSGLHFTCFFGSITGYANNNEQYQAYSVRCPADFNYGRLAGIGVNGYVHQNAIINWPTDISYYTYDTSQSVIDAIQQNSSTTAINNMNNQIHQDNQTINNSINNQTNQQHQDAQAINNSINNDNITASDADDLTNNQAFSDSTGLQAVIELPLNMINSLTNTCQPISITIPWLNYTGTIPCMSTIYTSKFNNLYQVVKLIINGFLVYRLLLKVYELVHEAKQPDEDKLEVIDL